MTQRVLELSVLTLITAGLALPLASASPCIAYGVWLALWFVLATNDERLQLAEQQDLHHGTSIFPALPIVFVIQHLLDRWVPHLGSALVLVVGLAMIRAIVVRCPFPSARVVR